MTFWNILNIDAMTDIKKIRHAYAVLSKECHPETEPEKFRQLYSAYQEALKYAKKNKKAMAEGAEKKKKQSETSVSGGAGMREEKEPPNSQFANLDKSVSSGGMREEEPPNSLFANLDKSVSGAGIGEGKAGETLYKGGEGQGKQSAIAAMFNSLDNVEIPSNEEEQNAAAAMYEFDGLLENSQEVTKGLEAFKRFFETKGKKDWKKFMTEPEFLRVQFNEYFAAGVADFLEQQTKYPVETLPFDMVKEFYFAYYPFMEEHKNDVFESGFDKLFNIFNRNDRIENVIARHDNPNLWNEVVKYWAYYGIYNGIKKNGMKQTVEYWNMYLSEIGGKEFYLKDGVRTPIDENIYHMLAFLIKESQPFPEEIYEYLIKRFRLAEAKHSSRWQAVEPIYTALEEKGIDIEGAQKEQEGDRKEVSFLMEEIGRIYCLEEEDDRGRIRNFFRSEIYGRHKLDKDLLDEKFSFFCCVDRRLFSKIFLEEYKAFYDEIYREVSTEVGKYAYNRMMFYMNNYIKIGESCREITENRKEWVLKYFFEEGFNPACDGQSKISMAASYKGLLMENLSALADLRHYERCLYTDEHLYGLKENDSYVFVYEKINEKATLSLQEYYYLLEQLMDLYINKYFCTASEKEKLNKLKERAGKVCGCNRN